MQNHNDNFQMHDENSLFEIAVISVLGDRGEQQDSVGYEIKADEGFAVVCDGMGGHQGGRLASSLATELLIKNYLNTYPCANVYSMLLDGIETADRKIASLTDESGVYMKAGSTAVAVMIRGKTLYWASVGDSRIYLFRNEELVQATKDHTYQMLLDEKRERGHISDADYEIESCQGEAVISFLGINGLPKIDANDQPFSLISGDKILLMSDGLYKLLSHQEMMRIVSNFNNIEDALKALELKAQKCAKNQCLKRDNMTVVLIKIK